MKVLRRKYELVNNDRSVHKWKECCIMERN